MSKKGRPGLRKLRFFLDALLTLLLLMAVAAALSSRARGEEARFRRAEKADLAGPSEIIGSFDVPEDWPRVNYDRLLLGDDGEEIFFYLIREGGNSFLFRREKTGGILLTPAPSWNLKGTTPWRGEETVLPLLLFAEDPAAVRAEVRIRLSDAWEPELTGGALETGEGEGFASGRVFLLRIPVPKNARHWKAELMQALLETNDVVAPGWGEYPAVIRLYDEENALLETREYTVRSRYVEGS